MLEPIPKRAVAVANKAFNSKNELSKSALYHQLRNYQSM
jgi:hypothetical protein